MRKKISLSIVTLLILILVLNHNEKPVQQHLLSQPEENPYQSLHILLNNEDFYQRFIELPKVENAEIVIEKMLENDTDEIEKKSIQVIFFLLHWWISCRKFSIIFVSERKVLNIVTLNY